MSEGDDRPQDTAAKLFEVTTLGMYGSASSTKKQCEFQGKTVHGLHIYKSKIENGLEKKIGHVCKYLQKCFPLGSIPQGLVPWSKCKSFQLQTPPKQCDEISLETIEFLKARAPYS